MDVNLVKKLIICRQCRVASFFLFTEQWSGSWEMNGQVGRLCLSVSSCADRTRMVRLLKWCQLLIPPLPAPASMCYSWPKKNLYRQADKPWPARAIQHHLTDKYAFSLCSPSSLVSVVLFFLWHHSLPSFSLLYFWPSSLAHFTHPHSCHTQERKESMGLY